MPHGLVGTVKIHGTHNDIVIYSDNTIQLKSRNVAALSLDHDPYNFTNTMLAHQTDIVELKKRIHTRFRERNPSTEIGAEHPLIIAGEWVGPGVQKACAINALEEEMLVIISISINGRWQPNEDYADISSPEIGIHRISRGGWYRCSIVLGTKEEMATSLATLQLLADEVEKECPCAKTFGKIGQGEGIVFKPAMWRLWEDAKYWLKVKGPVASSGGLRVRTVKRKEGMEAMELAKSFAQSVVPIPRLEQGWEFLIEIDVERCKTSTGIFLKWLNRDIEVEEKPDIEELAIN